MHPLQDPDPRCDVIQMSNGPVGDEEVSSGPEVSVIRVGNNPFGSDAE